MELYPGAGDCTARPLRVRGTDRAAARIFARARPEARRCVAREKFAFAEPRDLYERFLYLPYERYQIKIIPPKGTKRKDDR